MPSVPDCHALERHGHAAERDLVTSCKLQADWHTVPTKAARQSHGRVAGEIKRCRITLQFQDQRRLVSVRVDFGERKRSVRLHRNEQPSVAPHGQRIEPPVCLRQATRNKARPRSQRRSRSKKYLSSIPHSMGFSAA